MNKIHPSQKELPYHVGFAGKITEELINQNLGNQLIRSFIFPRSIGQPLIKKQLDVAILEFQNRQRRLKR